MKNTVNTPVLRIGNREGVITRKKEKLKESMTGSETNTDRIFCQIMTIMSTQIQEFWAGQFLVISQMIAATETAKITQSNIDSVRSLAPQW